MMLRRFWQNPYFDFCLILILFSFASSAQQQPGIVESLQKIMDEQKNQFIKNRDNLRSSIGLATPMTQEQFNEAIIHPDFLNGVFLKSAPRFLHLLDKDICSFVSLAENDLIKGALGEITEIPMITTKEKRPFLLTKKEFLDLAANKCPGLKRKSELFSIPSLRTTLTSLEYPEPKSEEECHRIVNDWKENAYLPYLCRLPQTINKGRNAGYTLEKNPALPLRDRRILIDMKREADAIVERSTFQQRQYLDFLCKGLMEHENFCHPYLASDIWTKVINKNLPDYLIKYKCQSLFRRNDLNTNQLRACAARLKSEPELCYIKTIQKHEALTPANNCSAISDALLEGNLKTDYDDCPGFVLNNGINNIHRIYSHFKKEGKKFSGDCSSLPYNSLAELYLSNQIEDHWPLNICYFDRIENDQVCKMYIPGEQDSPYAENQIVTEILKRIMPLPTNSMCKLVSSKEFNPSLLEYKVGCYIVKDLKNCNQSPCPRTIIVKEQKVEGIKYAGSMLQDYIPTTYAKKRYSGVHILENDLKIQNKSINNFTELLVFFKQKKNGIIHGIGCLEDLLPAYFKNQTINSCRPMSFIIDGVVGGLDDKKVIFRSAIDDAGSPRTLGWQNIFNAVIRYKQIHPLKSWALYGAF